MKINLFKLNLQRISNLIDDLNADHYKLVASCENNEFTTKLFFRKKRSKNLGWIKHYTTVIDQEILDEYSNTIGSELLSGVFLIVTKDYAYAIAHGQAHFVIRKYCDKDFGLNLAERIVRSNGLKMKQSQTFTSASKKDITSYSNKRNFEDSCEYGEAFSYIKCKTINKELWGESVDFGESARFSFGKNFEIDSEEFYKLVKRIEDELKKESIIKLPRYHKVIDNRILEYLNAEFMKHFVDYLNKVEVDDYWLTGVSFNFSDDYKYALKINNHKMTTLLDSLLVEEVRDAVFKHKSFIGNDYEKIKVLFYDENNEFVFSKYLKDLMQVTIAHKGKYYVLLNSEWFEFNDSYISYIEEKVDSISFEIKDVNCQTETELITSLASTGLYTQLHKMNVYVKGYCIEQADLMDESNIIMIKAQHTTADLVYLIKQATTSLRLSEAGELKDNYFEGRNICLWMLVERKKLDKLSDFKSFHLLDALNDFRKQVTEMGYTPVVWVSLKQNDTMLNEK